MYIITSLRSWTFATLFFAAATSPSGAFLPPSRAPLPDFDATLPGTPAHPDRLVELGEKWNLDSPLNRLLAALPR